MGSLEPLLRSWWRTITGFVQWKTLSRESAGTSWMASFPVTLCPVAMHRFTSSKSFSFVVVVALFDEQGRWGSTNLARHWDCHYINPSSTLRPRSVKKTLFDTESSLCTDGENGVIRSFIIRRVSKWSNGMGWPRHGGDELSQKLDRKHGSTALLVGHECTWEDNIKMAQSIMVWIGFTWLRLRTGGVLFWIGQWTFDFHKNRVSLFIDYLSNYQLF